MNCRTVRYEETTVVPSLSLCFIGVKMKISMSWATSSPALDRNRKQPPGWQPTLKVLRAKGWPGGKQIRKEAASKTPGGEGAMEQARRRTPENLSWPLNEERKRRTECAMKEGAISRRGLRRERGCGATGYIWSNTCRPFAVSRRHELGTSALAKPRDSEVPAVFVRRSAQSRFIPSRLPRRKV